MRDLASNISPVVIIGVATLSADTTPTAIDIQGYEGAVVELSIGVGGITFDATNKIEFVLTHADDDGTGNPGTFSNVAVTDLNGRDAPATVTNGIIKSLVAAHATAEVLEIGYIGSKRYLKLLADFSGTHGTGTPIGANLIKGRGAARPSA